MAPTHITIDITDMTKVYVFDVVDGPSLERINKYREELADYTSGKRKQRPNKLRFRIKDRETAETETIRIRPTEIQPLRRINDDIMIISANYMRIPWDMRFSTLKRNGEFRESMS